LTSRKVSKFDATRFRILRLKYTKFNFHWGSAPDPAGELTKPTGLEPPLGKRRTGAESDKYDCLAVGSVLSETTTKTTDESIVQRVPGAKSDIYDCLVAVVDRRNGRDVDETQVVVELNDNIPLSRIPSPRYSSPDNVSRVRKGSRNRI